MRQYPKSQFRASECLGFLQGGLSRFLQAEDAKVLPELTLNLASENAEMKTASYASEFKELNIRLTAYHMKEVFSKNAIKPEQNVIISIEDNEKDISLGTSKIFTQSNGTDEIISLAYHKKVNSLRHSVVLRCY